MDLNQKIVDYAGMIAYHRTLGDKFVLLFNSLPSHSVFLGTLLPSMSGSVKVDSIHPGDYGHDELRKVIADIAQYHLARKLWYMEQHISLCGLSTTSVPVSRPTAEFGFSHVSAEM